MQAFGLQDPHYFLSKSEILGWINDTLSLRLTKVEDTCNGAVACQLLDVLHPGHMAMSKVDYNAKDEYQMLNNYKVLQDSFTKLQIDKVGWRKGGGAARRLGTGEGGGCARSPLEDLTSACGYGGTGRALKTEPARDALKPTPGQRLVTMLPPLPPPPPQYIEVAKLCKGRPLDNLEFMQV